MKWKDSSLRRIYRLMSFAIPFGVMLFCFTMYGIYPLGDVGPSLHGDAGAEYYPFLLLMRRIFTHGESLLYSWRSGLGVSVIPDVFASFCTSALNLIGFVLPESMYAAWLSLAVCIRVGLSGYFLALLMQNISVKADPAVPLFTTVYALNMWVLTSYWQITMMDAVILTPLVLLGMLKLVRDNDMRLYPLMLACSLIASSYLSIFTAIMTGLFWIGLLIVLKKPMRSVPRETARFLGLSVLSAGIAMVIMLPSVYSIGATSNFADSEFHWAEFYADLPHMVGQLVTGVFPRINAHPANIASSMLVVVTALGYMTTSSIKLRERLYTGFVALFIFVSLWYGPLSFVWHGFHYPFVTVDRFAYLLPMVLAFMGWRFTEHIEPPTESPDEAEKNWILRKSTRRYLLQILLMAAFTAAVAVCCVIADTSDIILVAVTAAVLYLLLYLYRRFQPRKGFIFYTLITVVVTAEMTYGTWLVLAHCNYAAGSAAAVQTSQDVSDAVEAVRADAAKENQLFYRSGIYDYFGKNVLNRELTYDIEGGSAVFNSVIPADLQSMLERIGMDTVPLSSKYYQMSALPPLSTMLLDFGYVITPSAGPADLVGYEPLDGDAGSAHAFKFKYPTALGYCIREDLPLEKMPRDSVSEVQNLLAANLTGEQRPLYTSSDVKWQPDLEDLSDAQAEMESAEVLYIKSDHQEQENPTAEEALRAHAMIRTTVPESGYYVLELVHDGGAVVNTKRYSLSIGDEYCFDDNIMMGLSLTMIAEKRTCQLGYLEAGEKLALKYYVFPDSECRVTVRLRRFDEEAFASVHEKLMQSPFELTEFNQSDLTGTVETDTDSLLYLAMPYRKGWTAYVDGEETEIVPLLSAMTGVPLKAGKHTVRLKYTQPGLFAGIVISVMSLLIYLWLVIRQQIRRRKRKIRSRSKFVRLMLGA